MVQFDNQYRQIKIKIVYYGPALGGKTTCLQHIHQVTDPERRTKLYSLATASDRTLFFDLLSLDLGRIRGYRLAMQLYTVPGQVQYNATRRAVLSGADGVVFVADSQAEQRDANRESLLNLWENLAANGLDRDAIPMVLAYNKRDLDPLLGLEELDAALNRRGVPAFPTVAVTGEGVMDAFAAVVDSTLAAVAGKLGVGSNPQAVERLQEQARGALEPYVNDRPNEAEDVEVLRPHADTSSQEALSQEVLVGEAVRANLNMTDLNARLDAMGRQLARQIRVMRAVAEYGQSVSGERDPREVLRLLLENAVRWLRLQAASVLILPGSGPLRVAAVHRLERDPLLATCDEVGESLAATLLADREARLLLRDLGDGGDSHAVAAVEDAGFTGAMCVPMLAGDQLVGLLNCYCGAGRIAPDEDDLQLAAVFAATAAMGYANASAWRQLAELNEGLEVQVEARTDQLRESLSEVEQLNADLAGKSRQLEEAYARLAELDRVKGELIARVARELAAPVTSLHTASTILDDNRAALPDKLGRFVTVIRDESDKLADLIDSIVQATVLTVGDVSEASGPVRIQDLLRQAIAPVRDLATRRGVSLNVFTTGGIDTITCDPESMQTALRAVIRNGIEFNRRGGSVRVEVRRVRRDGQAWLELTVKDTGVGIPEADRGQVFATFWQGDNAADAAPHGMGLGLAIARRVVEAHRGSLELDSVPEQGTEVRFVLPQQEAGD